MASGDLKLRQEALIYVVDFIEMANPELLLNKLAEDESVLHNLFTGACEMENDLTLVGRLLEAVEKMIKWDRDF